MIDRMLNKAIEIEGLLRILKDGNPAPEVYGLLQNKIRELDKESRNLSEENNSPEETEEPSKPYEEDDIFLTLDETEEDTETSEEPSETEKVSETETESVTETKSETETYTEAETKTETEEEASRSAPEGEKINRNRRPAKLKSIFSLNDRFLYSRELFDGNMKMFDSTLDFLEGVDNYAVIEDYFFNEMEWDRENEYVVSFMEMLKNKLV